MRPLTGVRFTAPRQGTRPLLVLGPALGTSVQTLWADCAHDLGDTFDVLGWELPGHGGATSEQDFTVADLAAAVLALVDRERPAAAGSAATAFCYAGDSLGGAVGLQLCLDVPDRITSVALFCSAARFGEPASWLDRSRVVREHGTGALLAATPARWFAGGFRERRPDLCDHLLSALAAVDDASYAAGCEALADVDLRCRLVDITAPVLAVAGAEDQVTPASHARHIAAGVQDGHVEVLAGVAHLAPAEAPQRVADLIRALQLRPATGPGTVTAGRTRAAGMRVRREVLGDEHVDRATAAADEFTADFQTFITEYAWGSIWTRDGLDRRSRSLITLTALVARGHHDELAMHIRAARRNGLSRAELSELFLQTAVYCGVPDANTAFRIAQRVLAEEDGAEEQERPDR